MIRQRLVPILLLVSLTGGCASYNPHPLNPSENAHLLESRRLDDQGLRLFLERHGRSPRHWPKRRWSLSDLTLAALYENPEFAVQHATVALARAGITTAGQRPNPVISSFAALNSIVIAPEETSPWALGLLFDVPFETAGKRGIRLQRARDLAVAEKFLLGQAAWNVCSLVRRRFLTYVRQVRETESLEREIELRRRVFALWRLRHLEGESSEMDENSARLLLEHARLSLNASREAESASRVSLAQAVGVPEKALKGVRLSFDDLETVPSLDRLPAPSVQRAALVNRLDLRAALAQYAASEESLRLEVANQYPNLYLGPGGYSFDQGDNMWSVGFSLPLPILNQNQGPIKEARARRKRAFARFAALQFQVIGQIEAALIHYRGALRSLETTRRILARQKKFQIQVERSLRAGEIGPMTLMNGKLALLVAERERLIALSGAQRSLESLEDAVQSPLLETSAAAPENPPRRHDPDGSHQK
ncbi:MAG: TolC family protein [Leptospirillum sp.]